MSLIHKILFYSQFGCRCHSLIPKFHIKQSSFPIRHSPSPPDATGSSSLGLLHEESLASRLEVGSTPWRLTVGSPQYHPNWNGKLSEPNLHLCWGCIFIFQGEKHLMKLFCSLIWFEELFFLLKHLTQVRLLLLLLLLLVVVVVVVVVCCVLVLSWLWVGCESFPKPYEARQRILKLTKHEKHNKQNISWVVPLPSNSDHQDYYIFSRESQNIFISTITGKGGNPKHIQQTCHTLLCFP